MLVALHPKNPNPRDLKQVVQILNNHGIIILPTDTIYAMACRFDDKKGIEKMSRIAGKKTDKIHFSLICSDLSNISNYAGIISKTVFRLLKQNLPGPFTFILQANSHIVRFFGGNKKTIGIRIPDNAIAQAIVSEMGVPLIVTTIHHDDRIAEFMTDPEEIHQKFQHLVDCVIDGGAGGNIPSTIIDCTDEVPVITRQGAGVLNE